jgi:hypothetical protein
VTAARYRSQLRSGKIYDHSSVCLASPTTWSP